MKKAAAHLYFFTKRQVKQLSFLFILCAFPIFTFLLTHFAQAEASTPNAALYVEAKDSDIGTVIAKNLTAYEGGFTFYLCDSKEALFSEVSSKKAECGYILPEDLFEKMDNNKSHLVTVVTSPSTTLNKIMNEVVYAAIFKEYSLHLLNGYLQAESPLPQNGLEGKALEDTVSALYKTHLTDGSTFSFSYETKEILELPKQTDTSLVLLAPLRGLIAVFIFLSGFCGAVNYCLDKDNHLYANRTAAARHWLHLLNVSIPVVLSCLAGLLCLLCSGTARNPWQELWALVCYALLVISFCTALGLLLRNRLHLYASIPVFALGSLLFTPVFWDITAYLPALRFVSKLFVPYYYFLLCQI